MKQSLKKYLALACVVTLISPLALSHAEETAKPEEESVTPSTTIESTVEPSEPFVLPNDDLTIVTINGEEIKAKEVNELFNKLAAQYGISLENTEQSKELFDLVLGAIVQKAIIMQKGKELKLSDISEKEKEELIKTLTEKYNQELSMLVEQKAGKDASEKDKTKAKEEVENELSSAGFSLDNFIEAELQALSIQKIQDALTKDIKVTEEDIKELYDKKVKESKEAFSDNAYAFEMAKMSGQPIWYTPSGYRGIKHILLKVDETLLNEYNELKAKFEEQSNQHEDGAEENIENAKNDESKVTLEQIEEAKKKILDSLKDKIDEIVKKFEDKVPFDELVTEYGNDPGMQNEPFKTTGYEVNANSVLYDSEFTKGAFSIEKKNTISKPVLSNFGVHILYYDNDVADGPKPLSDEAKETLKAEILNTLKNNVLTKTFDEWKNEAKIVYDEHFAPKEN